MIATYNNTVVKCTKMGLTKMQKFWLLVEGIVIEKAACHLEVDLLRPVLPWKQMEK